MLISFALSGVGVASVWVGTHSTMAEIFIPVDRCWTKRLEISVDRGTYLGILTLICVIYFIHLFLTGFVLWMFESIGKF